MQCRFRILVIDDDPMYRKLLVSILQKYYVTFVACDGEDGFEKSKQHRPDLVIIDYQMPGWDGIRTLQAYRNDRRLNSLKAIMLTSDSSKEVVIAAIQAGANNIIVKSSFNKDDFLLKIYKLLNPETTWRVPSKAVVQPTHSDKKPAISTKSPNSTQNLPTAMPLGKTSRDDTKKEDEVLIKEIEPKPETMDEPLEMAVAPLQEELNDEELLKVVIDDWE